MPRPHSESVRSTPLTSVRIYPDDLDSATSLAGETGQSIAEVIRLALSILNSYDPLPTWEWEQLDDGEES